MVPLHGAKCPKTSTSSVDGAVNSLPQAPSTYLRLRPLATLKRTAIAFVALMSSGIDVASFAQTISPDVQKAYDAHVKDNMPGFKIADVQAAKEAGTLTYLFPNSNSNSAAIKLFQKNFPFMKVTPIQMSGGAAAERFLAEQRAGHRGVDVVNLTDEVILVDAAKEGLCQAYVPSTDSSYRESAKQAGPGLTYRYGGLLMGIVYVPSRLTPAQIASLSQWSTLSDPIWKGKSFGWISPNTGGSVVFANVYLYQKYGERAFKDHRAVASRIAIYEGTNAMTQAVVQGEIDLTGPASTGGPQGMWERGADIAWAVPKPTMAVPMAGCIAKGAPNLAAARLFWDWLLSDEAQIVMGDFGSFTYKQGLVLKAPKKLEAEPWYRPVDYNDVVDLSNETLKKERQAVSEAWRAAFKE